MAKYPEIVIHLQIGPGICALLTADSVMTGKVNCLFEFYTLRRVSAMARVAWQTALAWLWQWYIVGLCDLIHRSLSWVTSTDLIRSTVSLHWTYLSTARTGQQLDDVNRSVMMPWFPKLRTDHEMKTAGRRVTCNLFLIHLYIYVHVIIILFIY